MALDFPASPATNQTYSGPGGVVWVWDGAKWVSGTGSTVYAPVTSPVFLGNPTAPNPPAGDADTSVATTSFVAAAVGTALHDTGRNLIHNPLMAVAQRGAGPWTVGGYTTDRWYQYIAGGDTTSTSIVSATDGDRTQIGDEAAQYLLGATYTGTATASSQFLVYQNIEGVRRTAGKTVTLSFWARASSGTPRIGVAWSQNFGTGGSPSAVLTGNLGVTAALSSTFTRYTMTAALPSSAGKTLGTNSDNSLGVQIFLSCAPSNPNNTTSGGIGTQSGTIQLWGVQLEIGSVATPLEKPDPRYDLANCQRFYQVIPTSFLLPTNPSNAGWTAAWQAGLNTAMRANPTVVFTSVTYTNASGIILGTPVNSTSVIVAATAATTSGGFGVVATVNASADL